MQRSSPISLYFKGDVAKKATKCMGPDGVEPTFSGGTISTSQASTAGVVNQVSSNIGELSSVEISRSCGAPLFYSQPTAASEEKVNGLSKARAVLTIYRKKNPQNPELWFAAIHAESRHGYTKESDILMANALQEWPSSGILWAASIEMVPRPQKKN
ncbi:putative pre-mRNA splicing factor [Forsythia ovata]|uniref:Pre-mRNA splicing factor n=1 Tax=Forsythia ovata TaxID=205694 RepID=A0ABD1SR24_9LAMI